LLGVVWDDRFLQISFSHPMIRDLSKERIRKFIGLAREKLNFMEITPTPADESVLREIHTEEYVKTLKEVSRIPYVGFLDSGDTVHYPGLFEDVLLVVGSSLTAVSMSRYLEQVYVPLGGFHHALPDRAMGFCPVNDVAIAVKRLLSSERIAIVDVDAHHGNGLQNILYRDPVLKINIFAYNGTFFPGTGKVEERGEGEGRGLNYNVGLPLGAGDDVFEESLSFLEVMEEFSPTYVVVVAGVDGMKNDNLASLSLTPSSFHLLGSKIERLQRKMNFKVIGYGGGGYGECSHLGMVAFLAGLSGVSLNSIGILTQKTTSDPAIVDEARERMRMLRSM